MKINFLQSKAPKIEVKGREYSNSQTWKAKVQKLNSWDWEAPELSISIKQRDLGLIIELGSPEELMIQSVELTLYLKKEWTSMLPGSTKVPWLFLGNKLKKEYLFLGPGRDLGEMQFSIKGNAIQISWFCDEIIPAGGRIAPGEIQFFLGNPNQFASLLPYKAGPYHKKGFSRLRSFPELERQSQSFGWLDRDIEKMKACGIELEGYLFPLSTLGKSPEERKNWQSLQAKLKAEKLHAGIHFPALRMPTRHNISQGKPQWFVQDKQGNPLKIRDNGESYQVLDICNRDVQLYLKKKFIAFRKLGFGLFLVTDLSDLLVRGHRNQALSVKDQVKTFFSLFKQPELDKVEIQADYHFTSLKETVVSALWPKNLLNVSKENCCRWLHFSPLTGRGFSMAPGNLGLSKGSLSQNEAQREGLYHLQLTTGRLSLLGGDTKTVTQDWADKWKRIEEYHEENKPGSIGLNPMGFLQDFLVIQSNGGIASVHNPSFFKRSLRLTRDRGISEKALEIHDTTRLISQELELVVPGKRSHVLRF